MATAKISPKFFKQQIRDYSNWKTAFWRELFQNSVDSGANRIDITVNALPSGAATVVFTDNGCGMSRDTLENVFFSLGETSKNSSDSIGGFGKARLLLCYAQEDFTIRTHDMFVQGEGISYNIEDGYSWFEGCSFTITVSLADTYTTYEEFESALGYYLERCDLKPIVTINGKRWTKWTGRNKKVRTLTFADVYLNKKGKTRMAGYCLVRVNDVLMYTRCLSADVQVVVELHQEASRKALTSNRDGMTHMYSAELDRFIQELIVDSTSSTRSTDSISQTLDGAGHQWTPRRKPANGRRPKTSVAQSVDMYDTELNAGRTGTHSSYSQATCMAACTRVTEALPYIDNASGSSFLPASPELDPLTQGFVFFQEATDSRLVSAGRFYHPKRWTGRNGNRRKQVLAQWKLAIDAALDALAYHTHLESVYYRIGFLIADDRQASCLSQADKKSAFLLNPLNLPGGKGVENDMVAKLRYKVNDWASHAELLTLACHEVCHTCYTWHEENFANLMTDVIGTVMGWLPEIHEEMRRV